MRRFGPFALAAVLFVCGSLLFLAVKTEWLHRTHLVWIWIPFTNWRFRIMISAGRTFSIRTIFGALTDYDFPLDEAGFLVAFLGITLGFAAMGMEVTRYIRGLIRRRSNADGPRCPHCRYSLQGNLSGVCPECGTSVRGI